MGRHDDKLGMPDYPRALLQDIVDVLSCVDVGGVGRFLLLQGVGCGCVYVSKHVRVCTQASYMYACMYVFMNSSMLAQAEHTARAQPLVPHLAPATRHHSPPHPPQVPIS